MYNTWEAHILALSIYIFYPFCFLVVKYKLALVYVLFWFTTVFFWQPYLFTHENTTRMKLNYYMFSYEGSTRVNTNPAYQVIKHRTTKYQKCHALRNYPDVEITIRSYFDVVYNITKNISKKPVVLLEDDAIPIVTPHEQLNAYLVSQIDQQTDIYWLDRRTFYNFGAATCGMMFHIKSADKLDKFMDKFNELCILNFEGNVFTLFAHDIIMGELCRDGTFKCKWVPAFKELGLKSLLNYNGYRTYITICSFLKDTMIIVGLYALGVILYPKIYPTKRIPEKEEEII